MPRRVVRFLSREALLKAVRFTLQAQKKEINPGVRRYNVFWAQVEGSSQLPSTVPITKCPGGYIQVRLLLCRLIRFSG